MSETDDTSVTCDWCHEKTHPFQTSTFNRERICQNCLRDDCDARAAKALCASIWETLAAPMGLALGSEVRPLLDSLLAAHADKTRLSDVLTLLRRKVDALGADHPHRASADAALHKARMERARFFKNRWAR